MEGHWCFQLKELDGGRTRLVINGYQATRPRWFERFYNYWVYGPVVWSMHVRMLAVLKRNVERTARTPARTQSQPAKQRACNPAVPNDVRLAIPAAGTHSLRLDARTGRLATPRQRTLRRCRGPGVNPRLASTVALLTATSEKAQLVAVTSMSAAGAGGIPV
jgi:hypothetical protein